ncbi:MAG: hypothetical protein CEN88_375 [Candidatus Berkelbacteria bacterium Licking1014_2]|uniref:Uncharacterized protein n=1 Tax=Candidatus Berkelbacteria bacterium Licking1014_2 TaxID=2017146 RepID=A0A554LTV5_9BACT|nr:MAG: hypothetical protein CEN88_375 [Candidatus Berkelbacteria bacterium Licking1014_2]
MPVGQVGGGKRFGFYLNIIAAAFYHSCHLFNQIFRLAIFTDINMDFQLIRNRAALVKFFDEFLSHRQRHNRFLIYSLPQQHPHRRFGWLPKIDAAVADAADGDGGNKFHPALENRRISANGNGIIGLRLALNIF